MGSPPGFARVTRRRGSSAARRSAELRSISSNSAGHVASTIIDQHELDFPEKLNTSSYVTVVEEPEEEKVALVGLKVNLADQTVYPSSFDLHDRCVSMIAKLWHAPDGFAGAGCVGSTEACLLAGLALKFRWRAACEAARICRGRVAAPPRTGRGTAADGSRHRRG